MATHRLYIICQCNATWINKTGDQCYREMQICWTSRDW